MKKIILIGLVSFMVLQVSAGILMKPYLQAVTTTSVYVLVECDSRDTVTVMFGLTPDLPSMAKTELISLTTASPPTYVHKVKLSSLSAARKYFYQASQGRSRSEVSEFTTAVEPGTPFRFAWMADCRTGVHTHDRIDSLILTTNPAFSMYGGDLCWDAGYGKWKQEFFRPDELELDSRTPFFLTSGNHEKWKENAKAFTRSPASLSGTQDYYSFDYGDMHVLCINTELPYGPGSEQYKFAASDLSSTKKQWKVVICHKPVYGPFMHNGGKKMKKMNEEIFIPDKVDLVISGHAHFYKHDFVDGIHYLVIGSAGAPLLEPEKEAFTLICAMDYNWGIADVTRDTLTLNVYNADNKLLDSIRLVKH
jgi:acid phosphatase type 7